MKHSVLDTLRRAGKKLLFVRPPGRPRPEEPAESPRPREPDATALTQSPPPTPFPSALVRPFRWAWQGIRTLLGGLDDCLVYLAIPFGVRVADPVRRYAILLGVYAAIYLFALVPIPGLPLIALAAGYVGVLAVGRAWVVNVKQRAAIAKKLRDGDPDEMPELRWTALVSALQLFILFPLLFRSVQHDFGLYKVDGLPGGQASFGAWVVFTLDSYSKALLGLLEIYGVRVESLGFQHIDYDLPWGRHLVTLKRLTFDYILIQGIVRLLAIRETGRDAVAAVKTDLDMAVRLGRRALRPLVRALRDPNAEVRARAAEALGTLGYARAVGPLIAALRGPSELVRERAAKALGALGDRRAAGPLREALQDPDRYVQAAAAQALKQGPAEGAPGAGPR